MKRNLVGLSAVIFFLAACNMPVATPEPASVLPATATFAVFTPTDTLIPLTSTVPPTPTDTAVPADTATPTDTPAPTDTALPTATFTPAISPTPVILRGAVNVEKVSCRYGPGATYLFLYGLVQTATQDLIGRTDTGAWVLTQSHGDVNKCWVKAQYLDIKGDVMTLPVVYPEPFHLIQSPYYNPPYDVQATRSGDQVTITWKSQALRAGDEESPNMQIYIVEVWTCEKGQVTFKPTGTNYATLTVTDEAGCNTPSFGRVFFQEKHGFAGPAEIPWPAR